MTDSLPWWDNHLAVTGDPLRMASYRRLQSRWRGVFLELPPGMYVDKTGHERLLGSRLPAFSQPRHQLLSDEAVEYTLERLPVLESEGRKAEPDRLWFNMLSSQPLCFSLFGHLDGHREAAARVLDTVLPWPVDTVEMVTVEHAPTAAATRLGGSAPDNTAFDAMLLVGSSTGTRLIGVETKYTESFSPREYDKDSYREVCASDGSWFKPGAAGRAKTSKVNQVWRNTMLAQEAARDLGCVGSVLILSAANDKGAEAAFTGLQPELHVAEDRLAHVLLEDLIAAAANEPELADWAARFFERYLNLPAARSPLATA